MLFTPLAKVLDERALLPKGAGLLLAVSGGLDSVVLLHLFRRLARARDYRLAVGHVNHGLRGAESDADETFVAGLAEEAGLPFFSARLAPDFYAGQNKQAAARKERYARLKRWVKEAQLDYLLTAHHADDAAETLLINLLRGAGPEGLGGMAWRNDLLVRPLLGFSRAELSAYAAAHELPWREDATNASDDYLRNRLRHQVLPLLDGERGQATVNLARAAARLQEADLALRAAAERLLAEIEIVEQGPRRLVFRPYAFAAYPIGLRIALYRALLRRLFGPDLGGFYEAHWLQIDHALCAKTPPAPLKLPRALLLESDREKIVLSRPFDAVE